MKKMIAAIACRNQGSRLYGKPVQNLDVIGGVRIIDIILDSLSFVESIDEIILGISEGADNQVFIEIAEARGLRYVVGDQIDVLSRLIKCGNLADATDIFRITSESPFPFVEQVDAAWDEHKRLLADATFMDGVVDGCGFEILSLDALKQAHLNGESIHRSELCTLYIREYREKFKIIQLDPPSYLLRKDLRLTVDNPEDLIVCRRIYSELKDYAPQIPLKMVINFLDENPDLVKLIHPYTELGYASMYK